MRFKNLIFQDSFASFHTQCFDLSVFTSVCILLVQSHNISGNTRLRNFRRCSWIETCEDILDETGSLCYKVTARFLWNISKSWKEELKLCVCNPALHCVCVHIVFGISFLGWCCRMRTCEKYRVATLKVVGRLSVFL